MYVYDQYDQHIIEDRVRQFRDQARRFLAGELADEEFRPLRLQNGLYIQRYAPMLRIAVPYGLLSSTQVRKLAEITGKNAEEIGTDIDRLASEIRAVAQHIETQSAGVGSLTGLLDALENSSNLTAGTSRQTKGVADRLIGLTAR